MITDLQRRQIEGTFRSRLNVVHGVDTEDAKAVAKFLRSAKGANAQVEFFSGALAAIQALQPDQDKISGPPSWVIALMSGRPIIE